MGLKWYVLGLVVVLARNWRYQHDGDDNDDDDDSRNHARYNQKTHDYNHDRNFDDRKFNKRGAKCSLATFVSSADPRISVTDLYIQKLTNFFPLTRYDYRLFDPIPGRPADDDADLSAWIKLVTDLTKAADVQVAKWKRERVDYIGLPLQSGFLGPYLTGVVTLNNGTEIRIGKDITSRFGTQKFLTQNSVAPAVDDYPTVTRLYDSITASTLQGANLELLGVLTSPTGPVNPNTKLIFVMQKLDLVSQRAKADLVKFYSDNGLDINTVTFVELGVIPGATENSAQYFVSADLQNLANIVQAADKGTGKRVVIAIALTIDSRHQVARDFINNDVFCNCPTTSCFSPPASATCVAYPNTLVWGVNWDIDDQYEIPLKTIIGLVPSGSPFSIHWTLLGLDFRNVEKFDDALSHINIMLLENVKWASECSTIEKSRAGPARYSLGGDELKFVKQTRVNYWLSPIAYEAGSSTSTDQDKGFQVNMRWINAPPVVTQQP